MTTLVTVGDPMAKTVDRRLVLHCQLCEASPELAARNGGATLTCPPDEIPWGWLRGQQAQDFFALHRQHAPENAVGAEFEFIEKKE